MLEGKIALVTGASRGIGRQIALTLGAKGAVVIVNYNGSAAKAEEVVKEIEAAGGKAEALQCNVSEYESCGKMMEDVISRYGRLDILVNNAGITRDGLVMKMSEEDFDAVIQTNLKEGSSTSPPYPAFWEMQDRPTTVRQRPESSASQRALQERWRAGALRSMQLPRALSRLT